MLARARMRRDAARCGEVLERWARFQASPGWARYVARRVGAGARARLAEVLRLERWFLTRPRRPG